MLFITINIIDLFPNVFAFIAFYIMWFVWFIFEMVFNWTTPFIRNKGNIAFEDLGSTFLIIASSICCFVLIIYLSVNGILLLQSWFTYVGLSLFAAGMFFRFWAILVLGRYFSPIVGIYKDQVLVTKGPYKYVRHPSYSGALLMWFGYAIILRSLIGIAVVLVVMLLTYLYRIKVEEQVLYKRFPEKYTAYAKGKKKIIPGII